MSEVWKAIHGFDGRYEVSDHGRVRALPRRQRYRHWRSKKWLYRQTKMRAVATQRINSGYLIVHLSHEYERQALLVHRLVAAAFLPPSSEREVNHRNGVKTDNTAANLEWVSSRKNKVHAVAHGLNSQAIAVRDRASGETYPSISTAARLSHKAHRTVRKTFEKMGTHV